MFIQKYSALIVRTLLCFFVIVGVCGIIPVKAETFQTDKAIISGPVPQVTISTPTYPVGMTARETKLVPYSLSESGNISGEITSRSLQFYTQYGTPLGERTGPFATHIQVDALATTNWNELVYLPENMVVKARSMKEYAIVLKTTFSGTAVTGAAFSAEASLLLLLPPDAFGKAMPVDGAIVSLNDLPLKWNSSVGAIDYEYCFDTIDNDSCDTDWTGTYWLSTYDTFASIENLPSWTFYWQVRAVNQAGKSYANNGKWWAFHTCGDLTKSRITVRNADDAGPGSLRQAIADVCPGGTINFAPQLARRTIILDSTLVINKSLTIDGSDLSSMIGVSGNDAVTVFEIRPNRTVNLNAIIITDGRASFYDGGHLGGGIRNFGSLTISNSMIANNIADPLSYGNGGGIHNLGKLTIENSFITNNSAYYGGGIMNMGVSLQIKQSTISDNTGVEGAGIYVVANLELLNSTVSGNSGDHGGGITSTGSINIVNSTFWGNSSEDSGGGILSYGPLRVTNSTFSNNSAAISGGGIYNGNGPLSLINTILANSSAGGDCYNDTDLNGYIGINIDNLIETNAAGPYQCGIPEVTGDPKLGPLADNGGSTYTSALLEDSPAIDAGSNANCPIRDQRGVTRSQGDRCDIGAFEYKDMISAFPVVRSQAVNLTSSTSQFGTTNGAPSSLSLLDQTGTEDNPAAYVTFQTSNGIYLSHRSFFLPGGVQKNLISTMLLQVNIKAPASSQVWAWSIYDWDSQLWIKVGDTIGAQADVWQTLVFRIRNPWKYVSPAGEIRIQLRSNNSDGDAKVDYEALHITYLSLPTTSTSVVPIATPARPGISSASHGTPVP